MTDTRDTAAERKAMREELQKLCDRYGDKSVRDHALLQKFGFGCAEIPDALVSSARVAIKRAGEEFEKAGVQPDWETVTRNAYDKWNHGWKRPEPRKDGAT